MKISRVVPCGRTEGREEMTKLIVAFRSFANAPKNDVNLSVEVCVTNCYKAQ